MSTRSELIAEIATLQARLDLMPTRPEEPMIDSHPSMPCVVRFSLNYGDSHRRSPFVFSAVRTNGYWYVSGATGPNGVSWSKLWDWIEDLGGLYGNMEVASNWRVVK